MIDWKEIWKIHSPYYKDGTFALLLPNNKEVLFEPGPAFGDGSHPTTNLMLEHLPSIVEDKIVVDVGAGSGILSLAASKLSAKQVFALEIDPPSIETMKKNIALNKVENISINQRPDHFDVVLINMISSEQKIALNAYPYLLKKRALFLISGLLEEEVKEAQKTFGPFLPLKIETREKWAFILCEREVTS
jgi:ribosomal protein L11 methyltransferase